MNSVGEYKSWEAVEGLLNLVCAGEPILDTTYGSGVFWKGSSRQIIRCDLDESRGLDYVCSFLDLPFMDREYPTVVFDPPYHPSVKSRERHAYGEMGGNELELRDLFVAGLRECWRVTSRHLLVKCQGFIHNHIPNWMELWACQELGDPFEWLTSFRRHKVISGRWVNQLSLRRNHATYLIWDKRGNKR